MLVRLVGVAVGLTLVSSAVACGEGGQTDEALARAVCECGFIIGGDGCEEFILSALNDAEATEDCISSRREFYQCESSPDCDQTCDEELQASLGECAVGGACLPDQVPSGGFTSGDIFLEAASEQCDPIMGVCMVYQLDGDPNDVCGEPGATESCVTSEEVAERVYCTCRCSVPGSTGLACTCPDGFSCENILEVGNLQGGYCVRDSN